MCVSGGTYMPPNSFEGQRTTMGVSPLVWDRIWVQEFPGFLIHGKNKQCRMLSAGEGAWHQAYWSEFSPQDTYMVEGENQPQKVLWPPHMHAMFIHMHIMHAHMHTHEQVTINKNLGLGRWPEFGLQDLYDTMKELSPRNYPLTLVWALWHVCTHLH